MKVNNPAYMGMSAYLLTQKLEHSERMEFSKLCTRFLTDIFACPDIEYHTISDRPKPFTLAYFSLYVIHRTRLQLSVAFAALFLLQRFKARFPRACTKSGSRLILTALMLSSKVNCDNTFANSAWVTAGMNVCTLPVLNALERDLCSHLEWNLHVDPEALQEFEAKVRRNYQVHEPYAMYNPPSRTSPPATDSLWSLDNNVDLSSAAVDLASYHPVASALPTIDAACLLPSVADNADALDDQLHQITDGNFSGTDIPQFHWYVFDSRHATVSGS